MKSSVALYGIEQENYLLFRAIVKNNCAIGIALDTPLLAL